MANPEALPRKVYVGWDDEADEPLLVAELDPHDLVATEQTRVIGLYELTGQITVVNKTEISEVVPVPRER